MSNCYKKSNSIITVTSPLIRSLSSRGVKNIKFIPNGADCKYFKPYYKYQERDEFKKSYGFNKEDFILVYSGGIGGYYRIDIVIEALKKVVDRIPNIKLLVIGYGLTSQIDDLMTLSKKLNLDNNVLFISAKADELSKLLSCCNVGVVPYDSNPLWKNSLPVKSFEYLACGLPLISTVYKDSVLGKMIEENEIGVISNPEDIDALAKAIEKIYYSNLSISSKRAISFVRKNYDRNDTAKEFMELLETVAKS